MMIIRKLGRSLVSAAVLTAAGTLYAGQVGVMHPFISGTPAQASQVNDNFSEHTAQINDNDDRISTNANAIQNNANVIANTGLIKWATLSPECPSPINVDHTYTKVADLGTYMKAEDNSVLNIIYSGRLGIDSTDDTGVTFELRLDNEASTSGRIRGIVKAAEAGEDGVAVTMEGFFSGQIAGTHTISLWAKAAHQGKNATGVMFDPACWSTDSVIIKEYN